MVDSMNAMVEYSGDCYFGKSRNFYIIVGGLQNSQWGQTLVSALGIDFVHHSFWSLSMGVGIEIPFIYYETPYSRKEAVHLRLSPYHL